MHPGKVVGNVVLGFIAVIGFSSMAWADENSSGEELNKSPALLNLTVGRLGFDDKHEDAWRYGVEYRMQPKTGYKLIPSFGVSWVNNQANYVYAEVRRDFEFAKNWLATPSFGIGRFSNEPELDLGDPLEFRSGVEVSYRFETGYRLGVVVYHLSNGGLSETNPGTDTVALSFSIPLKGFW